MEQLWICSVRRNVRNFSITQREGRMLDGGASLGGQVSSKRMSEDAIRCHMVEIVVTRKPSNAAYVARRSFLASNIPRPPNTTQTEPFFFYLRQAQINPTTATQHNTLAVRPPITLEGQKTTLAKSISNNVQTYSQRTSLHPQRLLQKMVRLRRMPRRNVRSQSPEDSGDDLCLQEVQEMLPKEHRRI